MKTADFKPQLTPNAKTTSVGFVLMSCREGCFLCLSSIVQFLVPGRGYFFTIIRHTESFPSVRPNSRLSCAAAPPPRPLCIRKFSEQRRYAVHKSPSYILVRQGLALYLVGTPSVLQDISCRPGGDRSTVLNPFWHEHTTLNGTSQLKLCRSQWLAVDPKIFCTSCTCAHLCAERKCSQCFCCSTVAKGAFRKSYPSELCTF